MTRSEAGHLFELLCANYPRTKVGEETLTLWLDALVPLEHGIGEKAVKSLIASMKLWPAIAHLNEQVELAYQHERRRREDEERRTTWDIERHIDLPPLREIPAVADLLERWGRGTTPDLEQVSDGACDDCKRTGARFRLGRFEICAACARRRGSAVWDESEMRRSA